MSEATADFIDDAADLIETSGWVQERFGTSKTGFCVMGALIQANAEGNKLGDAARALFERMPGRDIIEWNDEPGRTQQEVLDMMRATAKQLRS